MQWRVQGGKKFLSGESERAIAGYDCLYSHHYVLGIELYIAEGKLLADVRKNYDLQFANPGSATVQLSWTAGLEDP